MKLIYAGLKPIINEYGIYFKDGKEDKYIYLSFAIEILNALNHEYEKDKKYSCDLQKTNIQTNQIIDTLTTFYPNLQEIVQKKINSYITHLDYEKESVENHLLLSDIEKDVYLNNLQIMREYKIQRATNKIFYFLCIKAITKLIIKNQIKEIDTPFTEKFWHILKSIQGKLFQNKIKTDLKILNINNTLISKLYINIY
ncbi:hypothetical protein CP985_14710 [Malaciobacter mytili LMG 24559]|uniref:Uncharacterized protein n=1 Tax=Malaciobacter mytili LMG 24559 TaxID=1032238 RepID=A0AAX2ABH5_9BACT|nr:hypothetical protein [Malaciobacter mytili]AXH15472.1 hypothetical protein AMYT_1901 [Malaciobacter mytili LMG 24559]RXK12033.1 hypothetical protein CP985_14710 [Malaciobacter mytili LMG 24559]